ncbi:MAG: transcriptional repressor NrdR [Anaerolineae bacterium]|nr:transcriptional repressor NrdR [Anaerolineae bacterium]
MKCPYCGSPEFRVLDTRDTEDGIRRRRECGRCQGRFTTYERLAPTVWVIKRDGRREEFDPEKIMEGVRKACAKRPVSTETIERLVSEVQDLVAGGGRAEISSQAIGDLVMERLRHIDEVAYVRFASVYVPLGDLDSIRREIEDMMRDQRDREA